MSSQYANIIIPKIYLRIIETLCKVIVFFGGRGGGKTEGIARLFLSVAYQFGGIVIFCARETQDEFCTTLMLVFKDVVRNDPQFQWLKEYCTFYRDRIEFYNGSTIYFVGLSEKTQDKIKGIKANFFWFDEAHALSKDTYELLVPSIREHNSKVVISFNTRYDYDFVSEEFLKNPASNVEVIQVNAKDNPYLSKDLQNQMEVDKVRLPHEEYLWKWEGGFKPQSDTALFDLDVLRNKFYLNKEFNRSDYTRIVIGIDPATTSKDYSNMSGLVVAGLNLNKEAVLIEDQSGLLKPNDLAKKCSELYHKYDADSVVVEVNQGGDYIKTTILGHDSTLRVLEVRAKQDKIKRMLPIANEVYLGRIRAISEKVGLQVVTQFRKFTNNGYLGAKGESPDRAEAFAWACFELLGISEYNTQGTLFRWDMLQETIHGLYKIKDALFLYEKDGEVGAIDFTLYDCLDKDKFLIRDSFIFETKDLQERVKEFSNNGYSVFLNDNIILDWNSNVSYYSSIKEDIDLIAQEVKNKMQGRVDIRQCKENQYKGAYGNLLLNELSRFKTGEKMGNSLFYCFCAMILQ